MTDASPQASQRTVDYLVRLVQMNPVHEGDEIVHARSVALGLTKKISTPKTRDVGEAKIERKKLLDQLESVRAEFWTMPLDALQSKVSNLNAHGYADLQAAVSRLRVVAAHRSEFPKLSEKRAFDGALFSQLKEVLIRSPRDTAVLREQVLSTFRDRLRRKTGRRMITLLQAEMPAIYELEADWFNSLRRQKAQTPGFRLTSSVDRRKTARFAFASGSGAGKFWWLIWIAIIASSRLFTSLPDNNHDNRFPTVPGYQVKEFQGRPFIIETRKGIGKRNGDSSKSESRTQPALPSPFGIDDTFPRPKLDPDGSWKKPNDGSPQ